MASETARRLNKTEIASEFLIQQVWGRGWEFAFLTRSVDAKDAGRGPPETLFKYLQINI